MLVSFLERFDQLGWIPPIDSEKRRLLAAHDVIIHVVKDDLCLYEFCAKGARGERNPWITIFFHVDPADRQVRICGVELTRFVERHRTLVLDRMRNRIESLYRALKRRRSNE